MVTQWVITALRCRRTRWLHLQYFTCNIYVFITLFIGWSRNVSFINLDLPWPHLPIFGNHCQKSNDLKFRQRLRAALRCRVRAVAEHDTQAISFSRRQCNDFTTIALPSPEKYCPCIRSLSKQDGNATTTAIHTMLFLISYKRNE
jgi:hypothetical protein